MKKQYTRPTIVKVELNHEQAILGTCSSGVTNVKGSTTFHLCSSVGQGCKDYKTGGSAATS